VLLAGWDAADWNVIHPLLIAGEMPNLARLMASGVSGNLATIYPLTRISACDQIVPPILPHLETVAPMPMLAAKKCNHGNRGIRGRPSNFQTSGRT
jgi:hypothetical protein